MKQVKHIQHYVNTTMKYTAVFAVVKMTMFRYFFNFAEITDCGYSFSEKFQ